MTGESTWEVVPVDAAPGLGWECVGAVLRDRLHLVVPLADRQGSLHVRVGAEGGAETLDPLALGSVSGAVGHGGTLHVGGAHGTTPVMTVVGDEGPARQVAVPVKGRLAAWPIPVSFGDLAGVVWAEAEPDAVVLGRITADGITVVERLACGPVRSLQAMSSAAGIDILTYGDRSWFTRWRDGVYTDAEPPLGSAAWLVPGAVMGPGPDGVLVWKPDAPSATASVLLPITRLGRVRAAWAVQERWLVWTVSEEGSDDGHGATSTSWVAPLDPVAWEIGAAAALPLNMPDVVALVGGRLVLAGVDQGAVSIWRAVSRTAAA